MSIVVLKRKQPNNTVKTKQQQQKKKKTSTAKTIQTLNSRAPVHVFCLILCAGQSGESLTLSEFSFLLRFLRVRKHSQLLAKETLENYWTIKTKCPEWFANIDPADKTLQELMRTW